MSVNEKMTELADAVRSLTGGTELLTLDGMVQNIRAMSSTDIISTASGDRIYLTDCAARRLHGLTLWGKTVQDGTPSPGVPLEPESAGAGGTVTVHVNTQALAIPTPGGLPGVPVTSDGNYTDASGQQWVCDEIDFVRGKYIKRVDAYTPPNNAFIVADGTGYPVGGSLFFRTTLTGVKSTVKNALCSHLPCNTAALSRDIDGFYISGAGAYCRIKGVADLDEFHRQMNGAKFVFILANPIETDLSAEILTAYTTLHTDYPQTIIHNDADAWMSVQYAADPKAYIDNKFDQVASAIVNYA